MDTARQVIRWSIPGWIFLFMLALLQILTWLLSGRPAATVIQVVAPVVTPGAVAMVVTAGVPLGFILYQIYYSWYGTVLPFGLVNRDRGADILLAMPSDRRAILCGIDGHIADVEEMVYSVGPFLMPYPFRRLKAEFRTPDGARRFETKVRDNWDLIRFWLQRVYLINKADALRSEIITLSDIYHGVGAARAALFLACVVHFTTNAFVFRHASASQLRAWVSILLPYLLALWLFRVFERTRTSALNSLLSMLTLALKTFALNETRQDKSEDVARETAHLSVRSEGEKSRATTPHTSASNAD